jgi:AraC-like DNA-binding protein
MKGVAMSSVSIDIDMAVYGFANARYYPALMQRPHRHNEVEMNFIEQGAITYLFGGARVTVNAGQIALFWATIPHQLILIEERTVLNWVTVPFATFLQWQLPDVLTRQVICGKFLIDAGEAGSFEANRAIFRQWYTDLQRESPEYRRIVLLEVEARLRRLALTMNAHEDRLEEAAEQHHNGALPPANEPSNVERMACFIAEHYTEPLNVEQVAQTVHLHPNYAMSLFRKNFGMGIIDYITHYRVSHAQRLLISTDANVSEIALESGFGSVSRFYTAFKAVCGQSPVAYRTSLRKAGVPSAIIHGVNGCYGTDPCFPNEAWQTEGLPSSHPETLVYT